jgi:L,D-transpeptidase catalytic domain
MMRNALSRRQLLLGALAAGTTMAVAEPVLAAMSTNAVLLNRAHRELDRLGDAIPVRDIVGIADYANPSSAPRFHLVDTSNGEVTSFLVSHGRGSDPAHSGWVRRFSNEPGSNASSEGAYRTGDYYSGRHGRSMRLIGLDRTNSNAEKRAIVVHGAWYVGPAMIREHGQLGRSEGCFAFAETDVDAVLKRLGPGRLLLSTKL